MPDFRYSTTRRSSAPTITTASTAKEARRVLDWQRDVALSISTAPSQVSYQPSPYQAPYAGSSRSYVQGPERPPSYGAPPSYSSRDSPRMVRRETIDTTGRYTEGQVVKGMSNQALFGTILGAAAGAAFAYAMVRSEEPGRSGREKERAIERDRERRVVRYYRTGDQGGQVVEVQSVSPTSKVSSRAGKERDSGPKRYTKYSVVEADNETERSEPRRSGSLKEKSKTHRPLAILPPSPSSSKRSETSRRSERRSSPSESVTMRPRLRERSKTEVVDEESWRRRVRVTEMGERRAMRRVPESVAPSDSVSNSGSGSRRGRSERDKEWERLRIRQRFDL